MNEVMEQAAAMPWYGWAVLVVFFGFISYRISQSKKNTGTYTGGIFGGGGDRPPKQKR